MADEHEIYDVLIIGGGPAGLSAAIWLARYLRSVVLVDAGDPRSWDTRAIHGFLGMPECSPAELREAGREACRQGGVRLVDACVATAKKLGDDAFEAVTVGGRTLRGRRLLIATGIEDVWPDIPGFDRAYGGTVHVCPDCDGPLTKDAPTVVIGAGDKAASILLALETWTDQLVLCTNGEALGVATELQEKLNALGVPIRTEPILRMEGEHGLLLEGGERLRFEHLFFGIGQHAPDDLGAQLGCARDEKGRICIDGAHHTSVRNVFAAGDITPGPQLAMCASAAGVVAGLALHRSLLPAVQKA